MLVDTELIGKNLVVSFINEQGKIELMYLPWHDPQNWEVADEYEPDVHPNYRTWDDQRVKLVSTRKPNKHSISYFLESQKPEIKNRIFGESFPEIYFCDIETEIVDGFPDAQKADTRVLSIVIAAKGKYIAMGLRELTQVQQDSIKNKVNDYFSKFEENWDFKYMQFSREFDMLHYFFNNLVPKFACITGWNFVRYDWLFLMNRAANIGLDPTTTSFTKKLAWKDQTPNHRLIVDYLDLWDKWDYGFGVKESKSLDFVAGEILGLKKISYTGDLSRLYKDDFEKFIFYNIVDTILVYYIDKKIQVMNILFAISKLSKIRMKDSFSTINCTEGILRHKLKEYKNIVFLNSYDKEDSDLEEDKIEGGWVKDPNIGYNTWIITFDFNSLYPTSMRQNNMCPSSYLGMYDKVTGEIEFNGRKILFNPQEMILTVHGAVFQKEESVTKQVLTDIYTQRVDFKDLKSKEIQKQKEIEKEILKLKKSLE